MYYVYCMLTREQKELLANQGKLTGSVGTTGLSDVPLGLGPGMMISRCQCVVFYLAAECSGLKWMVYTFYLHVR